MTYKYKIHYIDPFVSVWSPCGIEIHEGNYCTTRPADVTCKTCQKNMYKEPWMKKAS